MAPVDSKQPTSCQNLELLGRGSDDLQPSPMLDDTSHLSSVLDTEKPVLRLESGTSLRDLKRTCLMAFENVVRRIVHCLNVPTDDELLTNMSAPVESIDGQGFIPFIKKHCRRHSSQMPFPPRRFITRSIIRSSNLLT